MKRALYLGYYLKQLDREKFFRFLDYVHQETGKSKAVMLTDVVSCVFRYNISLLEYFQFGFYLKDKKARSIWAGTGYMYEYQLDMNPKTQRHILDDKTLFYKYYGEFFVHQVGDLTDLKNDPDLAKRLISNPSGKLVFKVSDGKCGKGVEILPAQEFDPETLIRYMQKEGFDLVEEFLVQHPALQGLSPSAVNTIRIFTQLNGKNEVELLGCRLRISVNSPVDNMAAGNLAAPIDPISGMVTGPAVYSDITKPEEDVHPVTKVPIVGFQVPFWSEILQMVTQAAQKHPQNRSIGWDVVVTENGPGLIEGNHDWCKLLWQLPEKTGLKPRLEKYRKR